MHKKLIFILFAFIVISACKNPDRSISTDISINDLISKMTLDEKIGQMVQIEKSSLEGIKDIQDYGIGSLLSDGSGFISGTTPQKVVEYYNRLQKKAMETRLQIPLLFGIDAIHGFSNIQGTVIFPHNIGLGCANDASLVKKIGEITSKELSSCGIRWAFAPCLAIAQDVRWGRTYESYSETESIVTSLGESLIQGLQGSSLKDTKSVIACAKHFICDGATKDGIDRGDATISNEELYEIYLKPYEAAIKANVQTIMVSFSSLNGLKMHENKALLTDLLKVRLGFTGFVISDYSAVELLNYSNYSDKLVSAINAGVDMIMQPTSYKMYFDTMKEAVLSKKISMERINDAVYRILKVKKEMGLFENPYADTALINEIGTDKNRLVAREAVAKSLVILKNDTILPLSKNVKKICVAGSFADNIGAQCGGWTITWQGSLGPTTKGTSILQALKKQLKDTTIVYSELGNFTESADCIIFVTGEKPYAEGLGDNKTLAFNDQDIEIFNRLKEKNIPIITIILSGRPLILNEIQSSNALVAAWLPGTEGDGIIDILLGKVKPTGKLSFSWPKSVEQEPLNMPYLTDKPLFSIGHGLTF